MAAVAYDGAMTTGHGKYQPTSLISTQSKLFVDGKAVIINGDKIKPHGGHDGTVITTQSKLFINNIPCAIIGDKTSDGDTIAQGSSKLFVG